ncbi:MAG: hypothetical protein ABJC33_08010 [Betaproteobacteria bacterium]
MTIRFSREMQITGKEFMHQLPAAIEPLTGTINGSQVVIRDGGKRVTITLIEEGVKHLGSLDLPMKEVVFEFDGYLEGEVEEFMTKFDTRTVRTGGD